MLDSANMSAAQAALQFVTSHLKVHDEHDYKDVSVYDFCAAKHPKIRTHTCTHLQTHIYTRRSLAIGEQ